MSDQQGSEAERPDGGESLPADPEHVADIDLGPADHLHQAADGLSAFNRLLWEFAKTFGIITLILFLVFLLFMAYAVAQWGITTL